MAARLNFGLFTNTTLIFVTLTCLSACNRHQFSSCISTYSECVRATSSADEVCRKAEQYEIWRTRENRLWMEEAITRGLKCADTELGREVARGGSYQYGTSIITPSGGYKGLSEAIDSDFEDLKQRNEAILDRHYEMKANSGCGLRLCP